MTFKDVATLAGFAQFEHGTAGNDFATVTNEGFQQVLEVQDPRTAVDQRDDVDTEHRLQLGLGVEVVEDHLRHFAATQLDHDAHTVLVGLVAQFGDAFELLLLTSSAIFSIRRALFSW